MDEKNFGIYLNKDKRGAYCNPDAPEKLIRYVTRASGERKQEYSFWHCLHSFLRFVSNHT